MLSTCARRKRAHDAGATPIHGSAHLGSTGCWRPASSPARPSSSPRQHSLAVMAAKETREREGTAAHCRGVRPPRPAEPPRLLRHPCVRIFHGLLEGELHRRCPSAVDQLLYSTMKPTRRPARSPAGCRRTSGRPVARSASAKTSSPSPRTAPRRAPCPASPLRHRQGQQRPDQRTVWLIGPWPGSLRAGIYIRYHPNMDQFILMRCAATASLAAATRRSSTTNGYRVIGESVPIEDACNWASGCLAILDCMEHGRGHIQPDQALELALATALTPDPEATGLHTEMASLQALSR